MTSLFEEKSTEIKKPEIKQNKGIPSLLPTDDVIINTENKSQIPIIEKSIPVVSITPIIESISIITQEPIKMSGAFFIKGENLIADIRLEMDVKHPKYKEYLYRLKDFVSDAEKEHVLKSSSGI